MTQFIFDSNYYRNRVANKKVSDFQVELDNQKKIEKGKNFHVLFPNIVAIELIKHLHDEKPESVTQCFNAIGYLTNHASEEIDNRIKGTIIPTFHDLLTLYFYNETSKHFTLNNNLVQLAHLIGYSFNPKTIENQRNEIEQVIQFKDEELKNIIENIENYYLKSFNPNESVDWKIFEKDRSLEKEFKELIAKGFFHKLFGYSLVQLAYNETSNRNHELTEQNVEVFLKDFQMSIDFFIEYIWGKLGEKKMKKEYLYTPKSDPKKRWNSFYDMQLIFAVEYEIAKGRNTIFVTQEDKIHRLFAKHKRPDNAISLETYEEKYLT